MTRIKICGVTHPEDAVLAADLGADALGLNLFRGSKRHVTRDIARDIVAVLPPFVEPVALFVNEPVDRAAHVANELGLRTVQWHGDEPPLPPDTCRFIPAFAIAEPADLARVIAYLNFCEEDDALPAAVLLDGHAPGQYGGTGRTAPWHLLAGFDPGVPVILAGGLTPENVAEAIRLVRPYAVDVAGGVESSPGKKDPDKLRRFIDAVRSV